MIGIRKRHMQRSIELKKYTQGETCMLLKEAAHIVNNRPIAGRLWAEEDPLDPGDFLVGSLNWNSISEV
jgi:hypothetical protein